MWEERCQIQKTQILKKKCDAWKSCQNGNPDYMKRKHPRGDFSYPLGTEAMHSSKEACSDNSGTPLSFS